MSLFGRIVLLFGQPVVWAFSRCVENDSQPTLGTPGGYRNSLILLFATDENKVGIHNG
jgi:hypothetical protein